MKKSNEILLKDALQQFLKMYHLDVKLLETQAIGAWEKVVGKLIARHTNGIYVKDSVLHVKVDAAELKQELMYQKSKIISRINKQVGQEVLKDMIVS